MQNEQSFNNEGISLIELFKIAWIKKWFILILTASFTVLLVLIAILINPRLERLSISFQYNFISESENTLPNGDFFRPTSLISEEFLTTVRDSNPKYSSIDIETILEKSDIISLSFINDANSNSSYYTIEVKTRPFGGRDLATDFIHDLISYFYDRILLDESYNRIVDNLAVIQGESSDYSHIIPFLFNMYSTLNDAYQSLQATNLTLRLFDATIQSAIAEFNFFFSVNSFENLTTIIRDNHYIRSDAALVTLRTNLDSLNYQKSVVRKQIDALLDSFNQISGSAQIEVSQLENLVIREINLQEQIAQLENSINNGVVPTIENDSDFINLFDSFISTLEDHIVLYNQFYRVHINNQASVTFVGGTSGQISGSISLILAIIGGLILGGGIATVAAIAFEYPKRKKSNEAK